MRVAIYVRSSKDEHGVSCQAQEHELRQIASGKGEEVVEVYRDYQLSSTKDDRPAFAKMLADAKTKRFEKVYALNTSRFGRDQYHTAAAKRHLRRECGVEVVFAQVPQGDAVMQPLMETILEAIDQLHRDISAVGARQGQRQNVRNGFRPGGRAPYGYRLVHVTFGSNKNGEPVRKSKLEPDLATAPIVREIFERRDQGESRGSICRDLAARGVLPPSHRETGNMRWLDTTLLGIEANYRRYAGHGDYDRNPANGRPADLLIVENQHEAIIDEALGERVFARSTSAEHRFIRGRSRGSRGYAAAGLLFCLGCGAPYYGDRGQYRPDREQGTCVHNGVSQRRVEEYLVRVIEEHVLPILDPAEAYRLWSEEIAKKLPRQSNKERLMKDSARLNRETQRLVDAVRRGVLEDDEARFQLDELRGRRALVEEALAQELVTPANFETRRDAVDRLLDDLKGAFDRSDLGAQQRLLRSVFDRIEIGPKLRDADDNRVERRRVVLHTLFPMPNTVTVTSPRGFEPLLPD